LCVCEGSWFVCARILCTLSGARGAGHEAEKTLGREMRMRERGYGEKSSRKGIMVQRREGIEETAKP